MKTVIFLGVGASASEGAPIQSSIFKEYFKQRKGNDEYKYYDKELRHLI